MIKQLAMDDPSLFAAFGEDRRIAEGESHIVRDSGRFPLCGKGDVNTYTLFAELNRMLIGPIGGVGCILPSGIASDDSTKEFFRDLIETGSLVRLHGFENEEFLFPAVHHSTKFCLLTLAGRARPHSDADFAFFCRRTEHLQEPDRHFTLTADEILLMNPNTGTCPIFRSKRDAEINKAVYRRLPVLIREQQPGENAWELMIRRVLNMGDPDTVELCSETDTAGRNMVRMYEAKLMHQFDHRLSSYTGSEATEIIHAGKIGPAAMAQPRFWIDRSELEARLPDEWRRDWLLAWRNICRNTDQRTVIACILPKSGTDFTLRIGFPALAESNLTACLLANLNTFVFDYCARQKLGGTNLSDYIFKQLPAIPPTCYHDSTNHPVGHLKTWLVERVVELTFTAWDIAPFARDCGYGGPPFRWDDDRRFLIRCELDAAYFHLYGINRDDADFILDTFPVVRKKDEAAHGEYRTKRVILEIYDAMADVIRTGTPYQTILYPPPGPPDEPLPHWVGAATRPANWPAHIHPPRDDHESD
jgi:hypothetical protein